MSLDIGQNLHGGCNSQFPDFGNCHNSRTSYDTDMKRGPVTRYDKRNTAMLKKLAIMSFR